MKYKAFFSKMINFIVELFKSFINHCTKMEFYVHISSSVICSRVSVIMVSFLDVFFFIELVWKHLWFAVYRPDASKIVFMINGN